MITYSLKSLILAGAVGFASVSMVGFADDAPDLVKVEQSALTRNQSLPDYKTLHHLVDNQSKSMIWLFTGDVSTQGGNFTNNQRTYVQHWEQLIKWEQGRYNDVVINTGRQKNTLENINSQFGWMIGQFRPQVVSVNVGLQGIKELTDQTLRDYEGNLSLLLESIRNVGAIPIIQLPVAVLIKDKDDPMVKKLWDTIIKVCDRDKVIIVDHVSHWNQQAPPVNGPQPWVNDGMYPNGLGHCEIFKKLALDLGFKEMAEKICPPQVSE